MSTISLARLWDDYSTKINTPIYVDKHALALIVVVEAAIEKARIEIQPLFHAVTRGDDHFIEYSLAYKRIIKAYQRYFNVAGSMDVSPEERLGHLVRYTESLCTRSAQESSLKSPNAAEIFKKTSGNFETISIFLIAARNILENEPDLKRIDEISG